MIDRLLDIAKENYVLLLAGEIGKGDIQIINRGTKQDTSGEWEEYTVKRWIWKDEPRESKNKTTRVS